MWFSFESSLVGTSEASHGGSSTLRSQAGSYTTTGDVTLDLPERVRVVTLPTVEYASNYPTLGPDGPSRTDVNGRAASIEFMFGRDLLQDHEGSPFPVRWATWMPAAAEWQGALDKQHKATVGERIDQVLSAAYLQELPDQVREGCDRLATLLLNAASPPPHIPATDLSDLTASWRREALEARFQAPITGRPIVAT